MKYLKIFIPILLLETLSFIGYFSAELRNIAFVILSIVFLLITIYDFKTGVLIALAEIFIGSKGYLFNWDHQISIRMIFFGIIILVFVKELIVHRKEILLQLKQFFQSRLGFAYSILLIGIISGLIVGMLNHNIYLFSDFNAWIYFLMLFPLLWVFKAIKERLVVVFLISACYLALKTLVTFYLFSHPVIPGTYEFYRWIRESGVGEVTVIGWGSYRVFFQSQIFNAIAIIICAVNIFKGKIKEPILWVTGILSLSAILISMSRSFWLGLFISFLFLLILVWQKYGFRKFIISLSLLLSSLVISFGIIILVASSGALRYDFLWQRGVNTSEAAMSSRTALLGPLLQANLAHPLLGQGFGSTITYWSSDPRNTGWYTTYAMEWGFLDLWLKLGALGLLAYLYLLYLIFRSNDPTIMAIAMFMLVTHCFSPYLNHPLGITIIILCSCYLSLNRVYLKL